MSEVWTTLKVLDWTAGRFERAGIANARLDAQVLLAHTLRCPRVALYTSFDTPLQPEELKSYKALIQRRLDGEPVAYLTGQQEFWSLNFDVDSRVLIPRPDTETLVQVVLELGDSIGTSDMPLEEVVPLKVVEVATGSGAISISLAHERVSWRFVATDLSSDALDVAKFNAEKNSCSERVEFRQGHLLEPLQGQTFDLLVSNLPYISKNDMQALSPEVLCEPHSALYGGESGVELIEELVAGVRNVLTDGGWVALEHGFDQADLVKEIAVTAGFSEVFARTDLAGRARVTAFRAV